MTGKDSQIGLDRSCRTLPSGKHKPHLAKDVYCRNSINAKIWEMSPTLLHQVWNVFRKATPRYKSIWQNFPSALFPLYDCSSVGPQWRRAPQTWASNSSSAQQASMTEFTLGKMQIGFARDVGDKMHRLLYFWWL